MGGGPGKRLCDPGPCNLGHVKRRIHKPWQLNVIGVGSTFTFLLGVDCVVFAYLPSL